MRYVVFRSGGKQYKASEGDILTVERLSGNVNDQIVLNDVLLYVSDGTLKIGNPQVSGIRVTARILEAVRGEKLRIAKYKAKVRYRKVTGHRQALTKLKIEGISANDSKSASKEEKAEAKKPVRRTAKKVSK